MILLILLLLIDFFAFGALSAVAAEWSIVSKTILYTIYWMIPFVAVGLAQAYQSGVALKWDKRKFTMARSVITLTYISKFVTNVVLVLCSLVSVLLYLVNNIFASFNNSTSINYDLYDGSLMIQKIALAAGAIPFVILLYGMVRNKYRYKIYPTTVEIPDLPDALDGLKIIQISDIHSGSFTEKEPIRKAIEMINEQEADLVFFTGDLVNTIAVEMEPFVDVFDKIKSRYGIYSILGNHDYGDYARWENAEAKSQNFNNLKNVHQRLGWDLILNGNRLIKIKEEEVAIIGVENYSANARFAKYGDLAKAYEGAHQAGLKLLLSHDPSHWEDEVLTNYKDIQITFSGHTHGMQFGLEIPGIIKWSPIKYVYKQWAGLYKKESQFLYVNRGFGFLGYPGRVGILPEITVMNLKKG